MVPVGERMMAAKGPGAGGTFGWADADSTTTAGSLKRDVMCSEHRTMGILLVRTSSSRNRSESSDRTNFERCIRMTEAGFYWLV